MTNSIYLVLDSANDVVGSAHRTFKGGRQAFLDYLDTRLMLVGLTWEQYAENNGFGSVEQFKRSVLEYCDWDDDFQNFAQFQDLYIED